MKQKTIAIIENFEHLSNLSKFSKRTLNKKEQIKGHSKLSIIAFLIIIIINITSVNADIYVGVVDGYVTNLTGQPMNLTTVTATVQGCSAGCTGTDTTDVNGYYVINNLNIAENDTIVANASRGNYYGNNTGTGDQFYTARINITMAQVPSAPTLQAINDTHNNSLITFIWTNYSDPQGLSTYNDWTFDSILYHNVSSPQNKTNVDFELYTWYVKTCNSFGCSPESSDTFNVTNLAPPTPIIPDLNNTNNNNITFTWTSGGADPDGDSTYFKFYIDGNITSGVTSPRVLTLSNGSHTWKVQECDTWDCSSWATDTFTIENNAPSTPNLTAMNATSATSKNFYWVSGVDPDADTTYDEFQFDSEAIVSPATSGLSQALSGTFYYTWKVRTCDVLGACSAWVEDSFVKFTCPTITVGVAQAGGGAGRAIGVIIRPKYECNETWTCTAWTPCSPRGIQQRACNDLAECGTQTYKPIEFRACTPAHCFNRRTDHSETGKDCGGKCKPCEAVHPEWALPYPFQILGLEGINMIFLIIALVFIIITTIIGAMILMKYSDHFKLYLELRKIHLLLNIRKKGKAYGDYYDHVLLHYKRIEKEFTGRWLDSEIIRLNKKARKRLKKVRL